MITEESEKWNPLPKDLLDRVKEARLLVVGAGGIGCELLKNLVLTGFCKIEVIDLDTIDVSNLNRQFLFQKCHVGKPKAVVARESVLEMVPEANIVARHDTIFNQEYNKKYFEGFDVVLNALDNLQARNHVNRMCLAADVPLVESGSAGYMGQVMVIKKGVSECYECHPAPRRKTFPGCTIRNTPSELIHCVVWSKYGFNQLFGEEDADQDVSPDQAESNEDQNTAASGDTTETLKEIKRVNTREWAKECDYNVEKVFNKLFRDDIKYLLSMDKLWKKRRAPTPLEWKDVPVEDMDQVDQQQNLTLEQNMSLFRQSINRLKSDLEKEKSSGGKHLYWDKDNTAAMDFTSSAANIRAMIFGIEQKSRFDIKSMAGNIIPAIATTNAIVAGLIVAQTFDILMDRIENCRNVLVCSAPRPNKRLLDPVRLDPPKKDCYICSEKREITIAVRFDRLTLLDLRDKILKSQLNMLAPDVQILGRDGLVLISSDEDDYDEAMYSKTLDHFKIGDGSRLLADDFLQNYNIIINLVAPNEQTPLKSEDPEVDEEIMFAIVKAASAGPGPTLPAETEPTKSQVETSVKRKHEDSNGTASKKARIEID